MYSCLGGLDERAVLLVRRAKHLDYQTHLMNVVFPREEGLSAENLGQDAPHRPDINRACVILAAQKKLWRPIPPCDHILRHEPLSDDVLARPKSHIFRSQFAFKSRLLGFRSRCSTCAV